MGGELLQSTDQAGARRGRGVQFRMPRRPALLAAGPPLVLPGKAKKQQQRKKKMAVAPLTSVGPARPCGRERLALLNTCSDNSAQRIEHSSCNCASARAHDGMSRGSYRSIEPWVRPCACLCIVLLNPDWPSKCYTLLLLASLVVDLVLAWPSSCFFIPPSSLFRSHLLNLVCVVFFDFG